MRSVWGHQGGEEHERRLDGLGGKREVLAEPDLVEADRVGALDDLEVFLQQRVIAPPEILDRVHEHAELHGAPPLAAFPARGAHYGEAAGSRPIGERRARVPRLTRGG